MARWGGSGYLNTGICAVVIMLEVMLMVSGYTGYSFFDNNEGDDFNDKQKNSRILMGVGAMCVALACILQIIFGFVGFSNAKVWAIIFMLTCAVASAFQLAAAGIQVQAYKDMYDELALNNKDDIYVSQFFLYANPMVMRIMAALMKYYDMKNVSNATA